MAPAACARRAAGPRTQRTQHGEADERNHTHRRDQHVRRCKGHHHQRSRRTGREGQCRGNRSLQRARLRLSALDHPEVVVKVVGDRIVDLQLERLVAHHELELGARHAQTHLGGHRLGALAGGRRPRSTTLSSSNSDFRTFASLAVRARSMS